MILDVPCDLVKRPVQYGEPQCATDEINYLLGS